MSETCQLKITVASDVDYDDLIAEIYFNDEFVALLQQEDGKENIKVEFAANARPVNIEWFQNALTEAKKKLLGDK